MQPQTFKIATPITPISNTIIQNHLSPMSSLSEPFSSSISFLTLKRKRKPQKQQRLD